MYAIKKLSLVIATLAALTATTAAQAVPIVNTYDPIDVVVTTSTPYSFIQDISSDLQSLIASGGSYSITSASLDIYLTDPQGGNEMIKFVIGSNGAVQTYTQGGNNNVPNGNGPNLYPIALDSALPDLQADGKLNVILSVLSATGDYTFAKSVLNANVSVVPEPASAALLGIGLLGMAARRRKTNQSSSQSA